MSVAEYPGIPTEQSARRTLRRFVKLNLTSLLRKPAKFRVQDEAFRLEDRGCRQGHRTPQGARVQQ
jgi:hypothetical protein